jgi:hypothetical protein
MNYGLATDGSTFIVHFLPLPQASSIIRICYFYEYNNLEEKKTLVPMNACLISLTVIFLSF